MESSVCKCKLEFLISSLSSEQSESKECLCRVSLFSYLQKQLTTFLDFDNYFQRKYEAFLKFCQLKDGEERMVVGLGNNTTFLKLNTTAVRLEHSMRMGIRYCCYYRNAFDKSPLRFD